MSCPQVVSSFSSALTYSRCSPRTVTPQHPLFAARPCVAATSGAYWTHVVRPPAAVLGSF